MSAEYTAMRSDGQDAGIAAPGTHTPGKLALVGTSAPMNSLSHEGNVDMMAGPSRLVQPSIAPVLQRLEITPEQKRTRKILNWSLIAIYIVILVLIGLAIWDMIVRPKERHITAQVVSGMFVAIAVPLSLHDVSMHFSHYVRPDLQRYYVRILLLVPIYAFESWLAIRYKDQKIYLETMREAYEAWVIYNFFNMLLTFCGGEEYLRRLLLEKSAVTGRSRAHMLPPLCWSRGWRLTNGEFVRRCKLGTFQYVFLRTTLAILTLILEKYDLFGEGHWRCATCPFPYFVVVLNLSQAVAMYCLVLFYHECIDLLAPLKPFNKFVAVKAVVFLSFWQGIVISGLSYAKVIQPTLDYTQEDVAKGLQDFIICIEMAFAAIGHRYTFSAHEFYREPSLLHRPQSGYGAAASAGDTGSLSGGVLTSPATGGSGAAQNTPGGGTSARLASSSLRPIRHHGAARAAMDLLPLDALTDARDHLKRGFGTIAAGARNVPLIGRMGRAESVGSDSGSSDVGPGAGGHGAGASPEPLVWASSPATAAPLSSDEGPRGRIDFTDAASAPLSANMDAAVVDVSAVALPGSADTADESLGPGRP